MRGKTEPAKNGSLTLVYNFNSTPYYLHSRFNPGEESKKITGGKDLSADHIVVLGLGLGYHLEKVMEGKDPLSRVLVVEPELEIFFHSLNTFPWHRFLTRPDFFFVLGKNPDDLAETLLRFISITTFDKLETVELPSETQLMGPFFESARKIIDNEIKTNLYDFKTRMGESYMVPRNILKNLPLAIKTKPIARLENQFRGVPGFIVSAGPSLDKNVLFLKKVKDRAVIIAVDTALKPLLNRSIQPHFTAIGDPSHKNYLHLQGMEKELRYFIAAEAGVAHRIFMDFKDKIFTLSIGKAIVRLLEKHSEPLGEIEAWGSVISIAVAFAAYIGLNPIIFLGQDFAFTDGRNHCRGTSWEENERQYSRNLDTLQRFETLSISGNKQVLDIDDIYGHRTRTSERLVLYKNFLVRLLNKFPQVRFINSTEGGILSEIPAMSLPDVLKFFVYRRKPLDFENLRSLPNWAEKENIRRLRDFLKQTGEAFEKYLEKVKEAQALINQSLQSPPGNALPLFKKLEEYQQYIYSTPGNGEILELWSAGPIYYFLRDYKQARDRSLDSAMIQKGLEIYKKYFQGIRPLVEDIIKYFGKAYNEI